MPQCNDPNCSCNRGRYSTPTPPEPETYAEITDAVISLIAKLMKKADVADYDLGVELDKSIARIATAAIEAREHLYTEYPWIKEDK